MDGPLEDMLRDRNIPVRQDSWTQAENVANEVRPSEGMLWIVAHW